MGLVGLPNVGKSSTFNLFCGQSVPAENFPFCTIEPTDARCEVYDERFHWLCDLWKCPSKIPPYLQVTDIAGLIRGASKGDGLGNEFLSTIVACDGIFHVVRAFDDDQVRPSLSVCLSLCVSVLYLTFAHDCLTFCSRFACDLRRPCR